VAALVATPAFAQSVPIANTQIPLAGAAIPQFVNPLPVLKLDQNPAVPGIPVTFGTTVEDPAMPGGFRQDVTVNMCEFTNNILPPGVAPLPTHVWGYRLGACPGQDTLQADSYIGPVVIAQRHVPTRVTYANRLGDSSTTKVLAYKDSTDLTLMWADPLNTNDVTTAPSTDFPYVDLNVDPTGTVYNGATVVPPEFNFCAQYAAATPDAPPLLICNEHYVGPIPAAPHLHGGEIPAVLDGGPDAWWTQNGIYGHGYYSFGGFADSAAGNAVYTYPNTQEAAPIWFHDHVLGATRLNVYAGIAGAYMIVDGDPLLQDPDLAPGLLPLGLDSDGNGTTTLTAGADELLVPIVLQDRKFDINGELYFDAAGFATSIEHPYWVPEFVGDTIVVNGKAWPFLNVQPKRYRFLFLNGSNARAYELWLADDRGVGLKVGHTKKAQPVGLQGPSMWVIGNDQGYLDNPVEINPNAAVNNKLIIMPGERYEVIIDFAAWAGFTLRMKNSAAIPYPFGGPVIGGLDDTIMQFRVGPAAVPPVADASYNPALGGAIRVTTPIDRLVDPVTGTLAPGVTVNKVRRLTLNEFISPVTLAPVELLMNNTKYGGEGHLSNQTEPRTTEFDPVTTRWNTSYYSELPVEGETEIWEIINFSADAHPIHPHLVAFQILNRQAFDGVAYNGLYDSLFPSGVYEPGAGPPLDYNCGQGLAAQAPGVLNPAECVLGGNPDPTPFLLGPIMPPLPAEVGWKDAAISYPGEILRMVIRFTPQTAGATAYEFDPGANHGYVWHCHIVHHEDNEIMRPYRVQSDAATPRTFVMGMQY
jgi:FtsP/CotA-like multicopper oxidase with cupredoxin domain